MNSTTEDVMQLLQDNGFGTIGVEIFGFEMNLNRDEQIVVLESGGEPAGLKELSEYSTFQILCKGLRGSNIKTVVDKGLMVHRFLISQGDVEINGTKYQEFEPNHSPAVIGRDENNCPMVSGNYTTLKNAF